MKDKRKEILRDLLGEFASDEDTVEESNDIFKSKSEDKEEVTEETSLESEEPEFNLDKVMKRPSRRPKTVKKVSNVLKAEIVEDGLIPTYNVNLPKFSDYEREIFSEVREKLVEVAVAQGEDFRIDEGSFIGEVKEFLRSKGVRDVDRLATQISQEMLGYGQLDPMIKADDLE
ncbi:MAG: CpaF family protein, partial [Methanobacterium sp.]|nr:CpaF family protein [Methanobacterium sp.]